MRRHGQGEDGFEAAFRQSSSMERRAADLFLAELLGLRSPRVSVTTAARLRAAPVAGNDPGESDESDDARSAETTVSYDQVLLDPRYIRETEEAPPVWQDSQRLRELLEKLKNDNNPTADERRTLQKAVLQQLPTLGLYRRARALARGSEAAKPVTLYVLMFPGEGKDNTGIKDLNDKVLGYELSTTFIRLRQDAISEIFTHFEGHPGPRYETVGQDYKTASILAIGKTRKEFAQDLAKLDEKLRDHLLRVLEDAARMRENKDRLPAIKKLRKTLERDRKYRFDLLFGHASLSSGGKKPIEATFLLITEALKGAGLARFVVKAKSLGKGRPARAIANRRGPAEDPRELDSRGKEFTWQSYLKTTTAAPYIRDLMTTPQSLDTPDYRPVWVNEVWTVAFLYYRRLYVGNPDVIRDVRTKALEKPPLRAGVKFGFGEQVELLELWLLTLNTLDLVKDFLVQEFRKELVDQHERALAAYKELESTSPIDAPRLVKVLTQDLRKKDLAALGRASEFQFYAYASDHPDRIFFVMDVRDLGVDVMVGYEQAMDAIQYRKHIEMQLMEETFRSSDAINRRKRLMYDAVVGVFGQYHRPPSDADKAAVQKAFGKGSGAIEPMPELRKSLQVMIGGDEIFVAAHPQFAGAVPYILRDLDSIRRPGGLPLNMRFAVAYSSASRVSAAADETQRKRNQKAHHQAMSLAAAAPGLLKPLERMHRRIERLIDKLEANSGKRHLAGPYRQKLDVLRLTRVFARAKHFHAAPLSNAKFLTLMTALKAGQMQEARNTGVLDLIDFSGNEVDVPRLTREAEQLAEMVRRDVGLDNIHLEPFPHYPIPKWLMDEIDDWWLERDPCEDPKPKAPSKPQVITT